MGTCAFSPPKTGWKFRRASCRLPTNHNFPMQLGALLQAALVWWLEPQKRRGGSLCMREAVGLAPCHKWFHSAGPMEGFFSWMNIPNSQLSWYERKWVRVLTHPHSGITFLVQCHKSVYSGQSQDEIAFARDWDFVSSLTGTNKYAHEHKHAHTQTPGAEVCCAFFRRCFLLRGRRRTSHLHPMWRCILSSLAELSSFDRTDWMGCQLLTNHHQHRRFLSSEVCQSSRHRLENRGVFCG